MLQGGLNPYCTKRGIVLEDLGHIQHTVKQGDFMMVNDLDSGYWHVLSNKFYVFQQWAHIWECILGMRLVPKYFGFGMFVFRFEGCCLYFCKSPLMGDL